MYSFLSQDRWGYVSIIKPTYYRFKSTKDLEFHDGLGFWVFTAVHQVQFLVERSCKPCRAAKKKKKKRTKIDFLLTVHIHQRLAVVPFQDSVTICNITSYCNKELSPRQLNSLTWNWRTPRMLHDGALKGARTWNPVQNGEEPEPWTV